MAMETACLRYVMEYLKKHYAYELELLEADVPVIKEIPCVTLLEAKEILGNKGSKNKLDLEPEDEVAICEYAKRHLTVTLFLLPTSRLLNRRSMQ